MLSVAEVPSAFFPIPWSCPIAHSTATASLLEQIRCHQQEQYIWQMPQLQFTTARSPIVQLLEPVEPSHSGQPVVCADYPLVIAPSRTILPTKEEPSAVQPHHDVTSTTAPSVPTKPISPAHYTSTIHHYLPLSAIVLLQTTQVPCPPQVLHFCPLWERLDCTTIFSTTIPMP